MARLYKYHPEDFGDLTVKVHHMDLHFDIYHDYANVQSELKLETLDEPISEIRLEAKNLEIKSVSCDKSQVEYSYEKDEHRLNIKFDSPIPAKTKFAIRTETICRPTKNILEGIYFDETPAGAPPQMITQCQQWGFQRIVPCIDDMTAKCTYTTRIIADNEYTNLLTNGDVAEPRRRHDRERDTIKYDNSITPMSTYLFFLGVGTYATFDRVFEYPDGSTFMLELLVPPGSDETIAEQALDVLHDSVMWIHLFTGPHRYKNMEVSKKILYFIEEREKLRADGKDLQVLREKIKVLAAPLTLGYQYTGTVYREIGMQNSNWGGMENVGNTTISTNRIMPFAHITDLGFEYMIRVKCHEFYHNLNGSEVTGRSPFEIWLNEAVTVHVEKQYHAFLYGESYSRLSAVQGILSPSGGTLAQDRGVGSMPIEPDGFNTPNELITGITYVKAPELIRMIQQLMGDEGFVEGLDLYHRTYKHSNASRAQWVEAMEKASGLDLKEMVRVWLKQTGFPILEVDTSFADKQFQIALHQTNIGEEHDPWQFPVQVALFDKGGKKLAERQEWMRKDRHTITFESKEKPAFVSIARGYSFYGKLIHEPASEELYLQVRHDDDIVNRFIAFSKLVDREMTRLLQDDDASVDEKIIDLVLEVLEDKELIEEAGGQFMTIFETVEDDRWEHSYWHLYHVRKRLKKAIAQKHKDRLLKLYEEYDRTSDEKDYVRKRIEESKARQVKNRCLALLAELDEPGIHAIIKAQWEENRSANDRLLALSLYLDSSAEDKMDLLEKHETEAKKHLVSWETFLGVVGRNDSEEAIEIIRRVSESPQYRIEQANDQRALFLSFAHNKKRSLHTEEGREFLTGVLKKLSNVNEHSTGLILKVFGDVDRMEQKYHAPLVGILVDLLRSVTEEKHPSVYHTTRRMLTGLPHAVRSYEEEQGRIEELASVIS